MKRNMSSLLQGYRQVKNKANRVEKIIDRELTKEENCKLDEILSFFTGILE